MNGLGFYVTRKLLELATKEVYANPESLDGQPHYKLMFELFSHKIRAGKNVAWIPSFSWTTFKSSEHMSPFETNGLLKSTIQIDEIEGFQDEITALVESASYASGINGDTDFFIVGTEDEVENLRKRVANYPVNVMTVAEATKRLQNSYNP